MTPKRNGAAAAAAQAIVAGQAGAAVTTPDGVLPDDAPPVVFDRLSVERRVLGAVTDLVDNERLGARNHLASIADWALTDVNTTDPPPPNAKLDVAGLSLADGVQKVLDCLNRLVDAGLVERDGDATDPASTYSVTKAGAVELAS